MSSSKDAPLEETYKALLKLSSPHEKAIVKDLSRTMPSHQFYKEGGGVGQESLFMVVKAYSLYVLRDILASCADSRGRFDQEVGYTQGLAFIVAALLLNVSIVDRVYSSLTPPDARRRGVLCPRQTHGLLQSALPLPGRHAWTTTALISIRPFTRRAASTSPLALRQEGGQELNVRESVVHDVVLI